MAGYESPLAGELRADALERFLRYVRIDTQSARNSETYPSTVKQLELSRLLADELRALRLEDVELTAHGYVFATLPGAEGPTVQFSFKAEGARRFRELTSHNLPDKVRRERQHVLGVERTGMFA